MNQKPVRDFCCLFPWKWPNITYILGKAFVWLLTFWKLFQALILKCVACKRALPISHLSSAHSGPSDLDGLAIFHVPLEQKIFIFLFFY